MYRILIVEDDVDISELLQSWLTEAGYQTAEAEDGLKALEVFESGQFDLVLLDLMLPGMDGFEVLSYINRRQWIEDIPVIMISGEHTETAIRHAYEFGAVDYINRPYDAKIVYQRVTNTIKLYAKQRRLISLITDQINEKEKNNQMMIRILSQIVEFRNGESGSHVLHINKLTEMLLDCLIQKTDQYQLDGQMVSMIATASSLHDIGKIGIPEKILKKQGKLTDEEYEMMKTHVEKSVEMIRFLPDMDYVIPAVVSHHERYDGKGYPNGIKGKDIPILGRILAVCDSFDAMISRRAYKEALSVDYAVGELERGKGTQFDPEAAQAFIEIVEEDPGFVAHQ